MTPGEVRALSETLTYLSRLVSDLRGELKELRAELLVKRGTDRQEMRRMREKIAKLEAEKKIRNSFAAEVAKFTGDVPASSNPRHERSVKKMFAINKGLDS